MSLNRPQSPPGDTTIHLKSTRTGALESNTNSIDSRLKYLKDEILPYYPFLLTAPSDVPFRLGGRFVNNWAVGKGGPFAPEESQLQYMTFLTHQDGDSLLVAVGDWSDGSGSIMPESRSGPHSAASTPNTTVKKKISLSDYKSKSIAGVASSESHSVRKGATPRSSQDDPRTSQPTCAAEDSPDSQQQNGTPASKRCAPSTAESALKRTPDQANSKTESTDSAPKRRRLSDKPKPLQRSKQPANDIPALLSPTLPPVSSTPIIPRLLSPTLPPDLEAELAKLDDGLAPVLASKAPKHGSSKAEPADRQKSRVQSDVDAGSRPAHAANRAPTASSSRVRSDSQETLKSHSKQLTSDASHGTRTSPSASSSKPTLVVKLRYGKANRRRVEALLRFSGKRKAAASGSLANSSGELEPVPAKHDDQQHVSRNSRPDRTPNGDLTERKAKKGPMSGKAQSREENDKNHAVTGVTRTPVSQPFAPDGAPTSQGEVKELITMISKKHNSGVLSHQPPSNDSETPLSSQQATKHPPKEPEKGAKLSIPSSDGQVPRGRDADRKAWKDELQKLTSLGRELKHTADRHGAEFDASSTDSKIAAATAIEAILCFILAFVADDQAKSLSRQVGDSSAWLSIIAYWRMVKETSSPYPILHSLCLLFGAVSYETIHAIDLERLAVMPLPSDYDPVPTPGSDGNTVISDESKRSRKEFFELRARLLECYREARRLWLEGTRELSEDFLSHEFPITWAGRSSSSSRRGGGQELRVGEYAGDYFLPFDKTATPIEVVRFAWSILREWCKKEDVPWTGRLEL